MKNNGQCQSESSADDLELKDLRAMFTRTMPKPPTVDVDALLLQFETTAGTTCASSMNILNVLPHATRSRTTRGRLSAICAVACTLMVVFVVLSRSGTSSALAQTQDALKKVRTATYTITETAKGRPTKTINVSVLGEKFVRAERTDGTFFVLDLKRKTMLEVFPNELKATLTRETEVPLHFSLMSRIESLNQYAAQIQPGVEIRDFGGREASGFVIELDDVDYNLWLDQKTDLPLRLESRDGVVNRVWSDFAYNKELDKSVFSLEAPLGFDVVDRTLKQARENAESQAIQRAFERQKEALKKSRDKDGKDLP